MKKPHKPTKILSKIVQYSLSIFNFFKASCSNNFRALLHCFKAFLCPIQRLAATQYSRAKLCPFTSKKETQPLAINNKIQSKLAASFLSNFRSKKKLDFRNIFCTVSEHEHVHCSVARTRSDSTFKALDSVQIREILKPHILCKIEKMQYLKSFGSRWFTSLNNYSSTFFL